MPLQTKQSSPSLADNALRLPTEFPRLPDDVAERFPSVERWQQEVRSFFQEYESGIRDFAGAVQDTNELGGVLIADPQTGAVYIKPSRGGGAYADAATPFFINRAGYFSLGSNLTWDPIEKLLTIEGTIDVDSGTIGGFTIGATQLSAGSGAAYIALNADGALGIQMGEYGVTPSLQITNNAGSGFYGLRIYDAAGALHSYLMDIDTFGGNLKLGTNSGAPNEGLDLQGWTSRILFGAAGDTNLYRSAANTLKTDDTFLAAAVTVAAGGALKLGNAASLIADTPVIAFVNLVDSAGNTVRVAVV